MNFRSLDGAQREETRAGKDPPLLLPFFFSPLFLSLSRVEIVPSRALETSNSDTIKECVPIKAAPRDECWRESVNRVEGKLNPFISAALGKIVRCSCHVLRANGFSLADLEVVRDGEGGIFYRAISSDFYDQRFIHPLYYSKCRVSEIVVYLI